MYCALKYCCVVRGVWHLLPIYVCSYDVVLLAGEDTILTKFKDFESSLVFSAEGFCWPDRSLAVSMNTEAVECLHCVCLV